jgi:DNA-binding MarR family transcriptional regulator
MITDNGDTGELRGLLRRVMWGLRGLRGPALGDFRLGRRNVGLLMHLGTEGPSTVSELAASLDVSLPAASMLTRELEEHGLVERREDPEDRRRTVVTLEDATAKAVREWISARDRPLEQALASLDPAERAAFLKGLHALADALMEESEHGPVRSHHRSSHRRRPHRH